MNTYIKCIADNTSNKLKVINQLFIFNLAKEGFVGHPDLNLLSLGNMLRYFNDSTILQSGCFTVITTLDLLQQGNYYYIETSRDKERS